MARCRLQQTPGELELVTQASCKAGSQAGFQFARCGAAEHGGASAYIDHADAIGSTAMETNPAGGVLWDVTRYPWEQLWQQGSARQRLLSFNNLERLEGSRRPSMGFIY